MILNRPPSIFRLAQAAQQEQGEPPTPAEYLRSRGGVLARAAEEAERQLAAERAQRRDPRKRLLWANQRDGRAAAAGDLLDD